MRLLLGPPGSGKTTKVLQEFCGAARSAEARLVVPTATMAEHLQHELARRRQHIPPSSICTLSRFASALAPGAETANAGALALLVAQELEKRPHSYPQLRDTPGLSAAIAAAIEELANSGCGALQWSSLASLDHRFDRQFGELYEAVEQALARAGLRLRAQLLMDAAARVRDGGAGVRQVWFDGFTLFSKAELALLDALRGKAQITVTLPEWRGAKALVDQLTRSGVRVERLPVRRPQANVHCIRALSREREAEEIALQILDEHSRERPWREIAVIVRTEENYLALLERTLARAGIPARAYFGRSVLREPAGIFFQCFAAAVISHWDGETTLALLRHPLCVASRIVQGNVWTKALEDLPFRGLAELRRRIGSAAPLLAPFESWSDEPCTPREWARRLPLAASLLEPPPADGPLCRLRLFDFRLRSTVFRSITAAAESLAPLLPDEKVSFDTFWKSLESTLKETRVYPEDPRRDVVHILDVQEARQWELPVVFVCGLLEGEFPRGAAPDPLLPEQVRFALAQKGFPVRTRKDREEEERFHFDIAVTRATEKLFLSWPERNDKGEPGLRAFVLEDAGLQGAPKQPARALRIRARRPAAAAPRPALLSDEALQAVRSIARLRATEVESYLQCPFQFFARSLLRLTPLPPLPSERLDARFLGTLAHKILADWHGGGGDIEIEALADQRWDDALRDCGLQETHQTILERAAMKRCLAAYAAGESAGTDWQVCIEKDVQLPVSGVEIRGRADRVDVSPGGECRVYDFKYSSGSSVKGREDISVQGGLYAEALAQNEGLRPAAIYFVALKDQAKPIGVDGPAQVRQYIDAALEKTRNVIEGFQSGRIEVKPAIANLCEYCDFRHACRLEKKAEEAAAAGGEGVD